MEQGEGRQWVAGDGDAHAAARAFSRARLRTRETWVALAAAWLVTGLLVFLTLDDVVPTSARLLRAYLMVSLVWALVVPATVHLGRRSTGRRLSARIGPGTELTSRFGPETFELAGPLSRHEFSYGDVERVRVVDEWVLLRQSGSRVELLWPAALFPDRAMARLRSAAAGRTHT